MSGKTWKDIEERSASEIRLYLLDQGGIEKEVGSEHESWRVNFSDSIFTYYSSGTLYSSPSASHDPAVLEAIKFIDDLAGPRYTLPTKDLLIGFDETGKGEVFGHTVLAGALFPSTIFNDIDIAIGSADTKKKHSYKYWDNLFRKFDHLQNKGLSFNIETIPPWDVDRYNLNKIMDVTYQKLLNIFLRENDMSTTRIVIDDYRVGPTLIRFLNSLENQGAEIVITSDAESGYLEAKLASLLAKRHSQRSLKAIRDNPEYTINGHNIGSGNAGDNQTKAWLVAWKSTGKRWPWFVKSSFKTITDLDGRPKVKKIAPPINERLLSKEYLDDFDKGTLSIQSLSLICPNCGVIMKNARIIFKEMGGRAISQIVCPDGCGKELKDAGSTLRYYCGFILPDNNAISRKLLGRDLTKSKVFENFTVVLSPVTMYESDQMRGAQQEIDQLRKFATMGRISLISPGTMSGIKKLDNTERDERLIQDCLSLNAIFLTADKSAASFAVAKGVFTIMA